MDSEQFGSLGYGEDYITKMGELGYVPIVPDDWSGKLLKILSKMKKIIDVIDHDGIDGKEKYAYDTNIIQTLNRMDRLTEWINALQHHIELLHYIELGIKLGCPDRSRYCPNARKNLLQLALKSKIYLDFYSFQPDAEGEEMNNNRVVSARGISRAEWAVQLVEFLPEEFCEKLIQFEVPLKILSNALDRIKKQGQGCGFLGDDIKKVAFAITHNLSLKHRTTEESNFLEEYCVLTAHDDFTFLSIEIAGKIDCITRINEVDGSSNPISVTQQLNEMERVIYLINASLHNQAILNHIEKKINVIQPHCR